MASLGGGGPGTRKVGEIGSLHFALWLGYLIGSGSGFRIDHFEKCRHLFVFLCRTFFGAVPKGRKSSTQSTLPPFWMLLSLTRGMRSEKSQPFSGLLAAKNDQQHKRSRFLDLEFGHKFCS